MNRLLVLGMGVHVALLGACAGGPPAAEETSTEGRKGANLASLFPAPSPHHGDPGYTRVPFRGYVPNSSVVVVPIGSVIGGDGTIRHEGDFVASISRVPLDEPPVSTKSDLLEYVESAPIASLDEMNVTFTVPNAPANPETGEKLFLYPALSAPNSDVLAVVLEYGNIGPGGSFAWGMAPWYIGGSGVVATAPIQLVSPGANIAAQFTGTVAAVKCPTRFCLAEMTWQVSYSVNGGSAQSIVILPSLADTQMNYNLAYGGIIEAEGVTLCSGLPNSQYTEFLTNSLASNATGPVSSIIMSGAVTSPALAACGLGVSGGTTLAY